MLLQLGSRRRLPSPVPRKKESRFDPRFGVDAERQYIIICASTVCQYSTESSYSSFLLLNRFVSARPPRMISPSTGVQFLYSGGTSDT